MDYSEHGGAPLLGTLKPVIKAHGSSNSKAVKNAIRQAAKCVESKMIEKFMEGINALPEMKEEK
jgi:glycerol-3-phosphate acyltransferase PlsX